MKGQPFFFDSNIFDDESQLSEEERAALPEFNREELELAKSSAFAEGKKEGFKESEDGITRKLLDILQKIERDMSVLFASEDERNRTYENEAVRLSACVFSKAFPEYLKTYGQEELKKSIATALSDQSAPAKLNIELNEELHAALSGFIKGQETALQKQITLKTDNTLSDHNCRISWPEGGLICNRDETTTKIFDILNQSLAERGISLHDETENQDTKGAPSSEETNTSGES